MTRGPATGRCRSSQRTPSSSAGRASPSASRKGRGSPRGSAVGSPSTDPGVDGVDGGQRAGRTAPSARAGPRPTRASRRILRGMVSPSSRSTTSQSAPRSSPTPMATTRGHRDPRCARRIEQRALHPHLPSLGGAVAPVHLQDQPARRRPRPLELEHARHPRGAAREPAQVAHGPAEVRPSAAASSSPSASRRPSSWLLDGDDRPPAVVELVQVLADAVAGPGRRRTGPRRSSAPGPR